LLGGLYLAILMNRYEVTQNPITIAFLGGLYIPIIMDGYERPQTPPIIAFLGGIYLAIIIDHYRGSLNFLNVASHGGF
jgi:hypothetical protein